MKRSSLFARVLAGLFALSFLLATAAFGQGVTTSGLNGRVTDSAGNPVAGATIVVVHDPSGTRATTVTRSNGQYNISGLRVGGPYTVSVEGAEVQPQSQNNVYLQLNEEQTVNFTAASNIVKMEAMQVTERRDTTFDVSKMSTNTTFNAQEIEATPTVRRDVQDLMNIDTRVEMTENTSTGEFSISAQGQNSRFNSFLIDGVQNNDPFGLNANGFGTLRSPIPLEALAALSIDLSPYDVTRTGFTGALVNAVTKSGTNEFHGSIYGYYTGKRLRGPNPQTHLHDQLQERTMGLSLGGPIVKNKLFFFFDYEEFKRVTAAPNQTFFPDPTVLSQIIAAAKSYGYDAGSTGATNSEAKQKSYLAKIDWNITDAQRATLTYQRTDSATPNFADFNYSTATSLSNHWYQARRVRDSFNLTLNSQWTPDFRTDTGAQYSRYNGTAKPNGVPFPEVYINGVTGTRIDTGAAINGQLDLGTNYSYQLNYLFTKNYNGHVYGEYSWGNHTFKFGADSDKNQYDDRFVQYYYGRYAFANPAAFAAGTANYLRYQQAAPGFTLPQGYAYYSMTDFGLLAQDTYKPNENLTLVGGLRFDYPWFPGRPPYNGAFYDTFGFRNNSTATGNYTLAPRLGANYTVPKSFLPGILGGRRTQIRGGIGLFQGTNPAVWVANSYQTAGVLNAVQKGSSTSSTTNPTVATFNPDPNYVQTLPPPGTPQATINVTDPNFKVPTSWKANLAVDHTLPWLGIIATAEANITDVKEGIDYRSINLNPVGTLPDGRIRYSGNLHSNFDQVLELTNTTEGGSQSYTAGLRRPMRNHWAFSAFYTHTHATEVQALTSSVATSNFNYRATINPNAGAVVHSAYAVPDKTVVTLTREFDFFGRRDSGTRISAVYRLQTGHAYSWVFNTNVNGDASTGDDALYVPTPDDPRVTWADPNQKAAFFNFIQGTDLKNKMGTIVAPNTSYNPQQETIDLHIEQLIPMPGKTRLSLFVDCLNFANLFNKHWGAITGLDFGTGSLGYGRYAGVSATYNATTNTYAYTYDPTKVSGQPYFTTVSRWQLQLGAKLSF